MNELERKIRNLYIFEWFEEEFLNKILDKSKIENFSKWEYIIKEWEISKSAYVIVNWIVSVEKKSKVVNTIFEWDIFWEISLVTNEKRTASVKAETDLKLLILEKEVLFEILRNVPNWEIIQKTILNRIIMNNK